VDFEDMTCLFLQDNPYLDKEDDRQDYGEERRIRLGWVEDLPFCVVYTVRGDVIWLISARLATSAEERVLVVEIEGERKAQRDKWESEQLSARKRNEEKKRMWVKREREER
jgi:uncharacterized DUF497 family protein